MKRISEWLVLFTLLALLGCGGSDSADKTGPGSGAQPGRRAAGAQAGGKGATAANLPVNAGDLLSLGSVRLTPAAVTAATDIGVEAQVLPADAENVEFQYRWFVDNQEVADVTGSTLPSGNFRKKQWVVCQVQAKAGDKASGWVKSNWLRIANAAPQLELAVIERFSIPGEFRYQVKASDIDHDKLTYELVAPLDAGIELDKKSGWLSWKLQAKDVDTLGDSTVISLAVADSEGKRCTGDLTLHFNKKQQ